MTKVYLCAERIPGRITKTSSTRRGETSWHLDGLDIYTSLEKTLSGRSWFGTAVAMRNGKIIREADVPCQGYQRKREMQRRADLLALSWFNDPAVHGLGALECLLSDELAR